ncbi:MAG TPA: PilZ domain-containing protein [Thermoanaerobaculia bacterium]|nr:PilZ domain-containing protein [Thermoanaerobaculia bacterium]
MSDDRRRLERVQIEEPIRARLGDQEARIVDLGLLGARVEHGRELEVGIETRLEFAWEAEAIAIDVRVTRCAFQPILSEARSELIYFSGLQFVSSQPAAAATLRRMIADHVMRALEAQKANARGAVAELAADVPFLRESGGGGKVRRAAPASFVSCRLGPDGTWKKKILARPTQPVDGFTVRLGDTEDEIERLCKAYKEASPEVRKLIRLCAEMSAVGEEGLPPQNFKP